VLLGEAPACSWPLRPYPPSLPPCPYLSLSLSVRLCVCDVERGQAWRDVAWYDSDECLRPLARLADNAVNRAALVRQVRNKLQMLQMLAVCYV
jgi:hypothetical protein